MDLRTASSRVFREADGGMVAELYARPINYVKPDGSMAPIDPALVAAAEEGFAWRNRGGPLAYRFALRATSDELVRVSSGEASIGFRLAGSPLASVGVVEGDRLTYPAVFPAIDLVYQSKSHALKELIVLHEAPTSKVSFTFGLSLRGLTLRAEEDGSFSLVGADGKVELVIPPGSMSDSSVHPLSGDAAYSEDVRLELSREGGRLLLTVTPDLAWLRDPSRVYPVFVDPTDVKYTTTLDTFVQTGISSGQASSDELKVGTFDGGTTKARSLFKFNVSSLDGKHILDVDFSIFEKWSYSCTARRVELRRITESWTSSVNWATRPALYGNIHSRLNVAKGYNSNCPAARITFAQPVDHDLTSLVKNWLSGTTPNYGIALRAEDETDSYGWKKFHSEDYGGTSTDPYLLVDYNTYPLVPINLSPANGTISTTATPTLTATYRDSDPGDLGHVDYQICSDSACANVVVTGVGTLGVSPGQQSPWLVPSGVLTSGQRYWWRARSDDGVDVSRNPEWTTPISFGPNRSPLAPSELIPNTGVGTSLTQEFSAVYQDADVADSGVVHFAIYDALTNALVASGSGTTAQPGERSTWSPVAGLVDEGEYYWRAWSDDGLQTSPATPDRELVIGVGGDIYHAILSDGDPATGSQILNEEWARINTFTGRYEASDITVTRGPSQCPMTYPSGVSCETVRTLTLADPLDAESYIVYTARKWDPGLEQVVSLLDVASDPPTSSSSTGALASILEPWQFAPPLAATEFELFEHVDPDTEESTQFWVERRTRMPIKMSMFDAEDVLLGSIYWSYDEELVSTADLPAGFFSVGRAANVVHDKSVDIHGIEPLGLIMDAETGLSFKPFHLGERTTLTDPDDGSETELCLGSIDIMRQTWPASDEDVFDPLDADFTPDPAGPETIVLANYSPISAGEPCIPGTESTEDSLLTVASVHGSGAMAAAARNSVLEPAQDIEANPFDPDYQRAGVRDVFVATVETTAYVVPDDDDFSVALLELHDGDTTVIINGDFDKSTLAEMAASLEMAE